MFLTYCTYCASDSGLSNVFVIALNIYCLCSACMSQSPSLAITIFSPILTRRRARDKLDSAATCDGHCKNKSTLIDTSANITDHSLIRFIVRLAFNQHPLLPFKPHVFLKQLRHISRLNFRHCHTNSPYQITSWSAAGNGQSVSAIRLLIFQFSS